MSQQPPNDYYSFPPPPPPPGTPAPPSGTTPGQYPYPQQWGAPMPPYVSYQVTDRVEKHVSALPLWSMITGIFAIPFLCSSPVSDGWPVISSVIAVVAVILGHVALLQVPRMGTSRGNGLAITGLVLGYSVIAISLVWILLRLHFQAYTPQP